MSRTRARCDGGERGIVCRESRGDRVEWINQYLVEADLPGLKKDDIKIEIDGAQVSISAEYNAALVGEDGKESESGVKAQVARVVYRERAAGAVARSFELPAEIDQAAASAKYEDGVLKLVLPKKVAETRKLLPIH